MPLKKGYSPKSISSNIKTEMSEKQACEQQRGEPYVCPWGQDDFKAMDADEHAIRSILSRCFSSSRRHWWTGEQLADAIERKRAKIGAIIDKYKEQAQKGRKTL